MEVTFIDFETATARRSSACSLGLVQIRNGEIIAKKHWYIQPPNNAYTDFNTLIHGISPKTTSTSPNFKEYWEENSSYFDDKLIFAHNAAFDIDVLLKTLDYYHIQYPTFEYGCTLIMSRESLIGHLSYRLDYLCDNFGISFEHHDALEDAIAASKLYKEILARTNYDDYNSFAEEYEISIGKVTKNYHRKISTSKIKLDKDNIKNYKPTKINPYSIFFEKTICFTGTLNSLSRKEAAVKVIDCGANFSETLNKKVNFLVVGDFDLYKLKGEEKTSKLIRAEKALAEGQQIEVISEDDFLRMIEER